MKDPVVVIGAVNMDLSGTPSAELVPGDSNPGRVRFSPGGVGRNIAENLCRLGRKTALLSILGEDPYGEMIRRHCSLVGMDISMCLTEEEEQTSTYLCLTEKDGDLHAAVSDMNIYRLLTPERLLPVLPRLNGAELVIVDANIPEETIRWIGEHVTAPLAADPVSAAKVLRLRPLLNRLVLIKPNTAEAELLTGLPVRSDEDLPRLSAELRSRGVRQVYISLGERGVWADDGVFQGRIPCFPGEIRNTTGCGDAFMAAAADAWLDGKTAEETARWALAAAAHCAGDYHSVSPDLSRAALTEIIQKESSR